MNWQLFTAVILTMAVVIGGVITLWRWLRLSDLISVQHGEQWADSDAALLLVDEAERVIDANPTAQQIVGEMSQGKTVTAVLEPLKTTYTHHTIPLTNWRGQAKGNLLILQPLPPAPEPEPEPEPITETPQMIPYQVLRAIGEILEPETVAYVAVQAIADLTQWPTVAIAMPDELGKLVIRAAIGIPFMDEGVNGRAFRTGHTQVIPNPNGSTPFFTGFNAPPSALAIPLSRGRKPIGVLNIESDQPNAFDEADLLLAESLADAIVLALDNARLFTEAQNRLTEQTVLRQSMSAISSTLDLNTILYDLAEQMSYLMNATSVYICSYNNKQKTTTVLAEYYGPRASEVERVSDVGTTYYLPNHFPGTDHSLDSGTPLLTYVDDPAVPANKRQHLQEFDGYTSLVIPLQVGGKAIAFAEIWESQQRRAFTEAEIQLCQDIAHHAAVAIENARLFKAIADERTRLQALIEADRDGIILVGSSGDILVMNEPARAFLQLDEHLHHWIHKSALDVIDYLSENSPIVAKIANQERERIEAGDTQAKEGEFDFAPRSIHWRSLPVISEDKVHNRLIVLRDITEEKLLEKMRNDLIHTMVHDLRSPLTSISITLDLLGMYIGEPSELRVHQALERARSSIVHMLSMVNAILDISRLESGRVVLAYRSVTFSSILNPVVDMQMPLIIENNIEIVKDIPADLPLVRVDAALIERVLQNLLNNAVKFTPKGGTVRIEAEEQETAVLVSVSDTGAGVPNSVHGRLFQKFSTGDQAERGSGLGLAFCRMAIEAHRQRIWLADSSDQGTTFKFTLPLAPLLHTSVEVDEVNVSSL